MLLTTGQYDLWIESKGKGSWNMGTVYKPILSKGGEAHHCLKTRFW